MSAQPPRGPSARRPTVVVVDDHELFRAGVRGELQTACDVVGEAGDVASGVETVLATTPDVVLLDVHLPGGGAVEVLRGLRAAGSRSRVLALSVSDAAEDVVAVIRAGANGYVTKTIRAADLVDAILRTDEGEPVFGPRLATFVLRAFAEGPPADDPDDLDALTPREREVLHHLARGYAYKQIALRMEISPRTVESHVGSVLRKLQLTSRHEVSHWAARRGLLE
jgi:DNA-binding NarL/FixJ family response regulator